MTEKQEVTGKGEVRERLHAFNELMNKNPALREKLMGLQGKGVDVLEILRLGRKVWKKNAGNGGA